MALASGITHLHAKHLLRSLQKKLIFNRKKIPCYKNIFSGIVLANCGCALSSFFMCSRFSLRKFFFFLMERVDSMKLPHESWLKNCIYISLLLSDF